MSAVPNTNAEGDENLDTEVDQVSDQLNPLEMSDEDFLKQAAPAAVVAPKADAVVDPGTEDEADPKKQGTATGAADGDQPDAKTGDGTGGKTATPTPQATPDKPAKVDEDGKAADAQADKTDPTDPAAKAADFDFAAAGKALLAPFKANGREIRVDTVEDARALMQMGANYNKKMAGMKPSLKILKLLENNGLLDEGKLGFLIDLSKKDTGAINKLVKDSGINPMEIDPEKAGDYRPTAHTVDDREMDLDAVLDDIKDSSSYVKTLGVAKAWDADSKKVIGDQPALLKVINGHMESGVYDLISAEVERERTFGRLQGLSDIAAYRQVGDAIQARGGFNHLFKPDGAGPGKASEAGKVVEPKPKKDDDESRNAKRRALGTPKPAAPSGSKPADFNPLGMSDEEFAKQAAPKFR